jgi:hypothetical protein
MAEGDANLGDNFSKETLSGRRMSSPAAFFRLEVFPDLYR